MVESLSESLPAVRVTPTTKRRLDAYAASHRLTSNLSDHVRLALDEYLDRYAPIASPSPATAVQDPDGALLPR